MPSIRTKSSLIPVGGAEFVVTHMPTNDTLAQYVQDLQDKGVKHLIRVAKIEYDDALLRQEGFILHDWPYGDGSHPPENVIEAFFNLTREVFVHLIKPAKQKVSLRERAYSTGSRGRPSSTPPTPQPKAGPIALHCVSGLGRAPVLVALFCMHSGMTADEAVVHIRKHRYGALNDRQVGFLKKYAVPETPTEESNKKCAIM